MKIKPKTQPLPEGIPEATHCVRQYKAHQIAKLLMDPAITDEQVKYITDDLILATDTSEHEHVEHSLDLWRLDKPNVILEALVKHYNDLPHYTVSTLLEYFTMNCYEGWRDDDYSFVITYHNLLREKNLLVEDIRKQYYWMNNSIYSEVDPVTQISPYNNYNSPVIFAERDDCPEEIILALCSDLEPWIRKVAVNHVNCPREGKVASALMGGGVQW